MIVLTIILAIALILLTAWAVPTVLAWVLTQGAAWVTRNLVAVDPRTEYSRLDKLDGS